ncbi:ParA family protein, partial [Vibrio lentus]|uniref:ParA family protein n=2 Tax=Vibrio TaxID=662 RepID=UPI001E504B60
YKGGTGKSTTAVTLATKAALDLDLNAKVCLLDLDPQGSAARGIIQIDESREQHYITIADLQCYDLTEEQGDENQVKALLEHGVPFEQIVLAS